MSKIAAKEKKPIKKTKTKIKEKATIQKSQIDSVLVPLTPKQEEKLNKSFDSVEKYLKGAFYSTLILIVFSLYWMFRPDGDIVTFLFSIPFSIGIIYSYRLFSKQSKKSITAFSSSFGIFILYSIVSTWFLRLRPFTVGEAVGFIFYIAILIDMFRLKKYSYLY